MLRGSSLIDGDSTYASAFAEFAEFPQWKAFENEEERKDVFASIMKKLRIDESVMIFDSIQKININGKLKGKKKLKKIKIERET